ncbi:MAG: sensor protein [Rhizobacter sp.]|nr:sensor protein [Rhizobacter sp.]
MRIPFPQSLVGRVTLLVAVVTLVSLAQDVLVLRSLLFKPLNQELTALLVGEARMTLAVLQRTPIAQRDAAVQGLSTPPLRVQRCPEGVSPWLPDVAANADPARPPRPSTSTWLPLRDNDLSLDDSQLALLGHDARLLQGPGDSFSPVLEWTLDGECWSLAHDRAPQGAHGWVPVLSLVVLVTLTIGFGLLFGVTGIARPLSSLAHQIGAQRNGLREITPDKQAGTELRQITAAFNSLVHSVEEAQRTREHLLAGLSHDLRTPLSRLRLRIETQCDEPVSSALLRDADAMGRIIDQFLAYIQGDAHLQLGLNAPLVETVHQVVASYAEQSVRMEIEDHGPWSADFDESADALPDDAIDDEAPDLAVSRLLSNLIDNALAYGAPPVVVRLSATEDEVHLAVVDHGRGLDPSQFASALQPFVRLDEQNQSVGHCGLGLAIVAQIARQLGGRLHSSREGDAFCIVVSLPRIRLSAEV